MTSLGGYTVTATLHEGEGVAVYRAVRDLDHLHVILKVLDPRRCRPCDLDRFKTEQQLADALDSAAIVKLLAHEHREGLFVHVFEDFGGEPLYRLIGAPIEAPRFLDLAVRVAKALAEVHRCGVVHRDIKPGSIFVNASTLDVKICGFGIAARASAASVAERRPALIEGSLPYMSPEQTGRIGRAVDARSDLYSLGVTFYEMLTGRLPFQATDPVEWVYCHIARSPAPPAELVPQLPATLCAIVSRLLAKMPEDRYQTAKGLRYDLERALSAFRREGRIDPFPLGERDVPDRFRIPQRLYGRDEEIAALRRAFERVSADGTTEVVAVSGYSGIGKSALVHELHRPIFRQRGLFAEGKFDPLKRDVPYATIAQALTGLVNEILAESEERIAAWRDQLRIVLGVNGQLIIDVIPAIELVLGRQAPVPALSPTEAQNRFCDVFRRFIGVFARPERPLVLFLDDLQWADSASLTLLQVLVTHPGTRGVLLVCAYRDNEVTPSHPLLRVFSEAEKAGAKVSRIVLRPLSREHLSALIGDTLRCGLEEAAPLSELVAEKTAGNPFFAIQFLTTLYEKRLIAFDSDRGAWRWDVATIHAQNITDNIVDLMVEKLKRLPAATQQALTELACLGTSAPISTLSLVLGRTEEQTRAKLAEAVQAGLVVRVGEAVRFIHDRVHEAAYSLTPKEQQAAAHLRIGRLFLSRWSAATIEERVFDVVSQLDRAVDQITDPAEKEALCRLDFLAGRKAKAAIAYVSAQRWLAQATALLPADAWSSRYEEALEIYLERSECEYLAGNFVEADDLFNLIIDRARGRLDCARAYRLRMRLYQVAGRYDEAVTVALKALELFGVTFPDTDDAIREATEEEALRIAQNLRGRRIADLAFAEMAVDPEARAILSLLVEAEPCAYIGRPTLFPLLALKAVNVSLLHGNTEESCFAYSVYGFMLVSVFGDIPAGFEFSEMSLRLNEKLNDLRLRGTLLHLHGDHINFWRRPIATDLPILERAFRACLDVGDLVYAGFLAFETVWQLVEKGDPLDEVLSASQAYAAFARESHNVAVYETIRLEQRFIASLKGETSSLSSFRGADFDEDACFGAITRATFGCGIAFFHILKQIAAFNDGRYDEANESAARASSTLGAVMAMPIEATHLFYVALTLAAQRPDAPAASQRELDRRLDGALQKLKLWADNCPENYFNRYALVSAEVAQLAGRDLEAMRLYDQAIQSAGENGFVQNEALASELASRFYRRRGFVRSADTYLREARACYVRWGAAGKVRQLDLLHPQLRAHAPQSSALTVAVGAEQLDALSVVKASQAIAGEIVLDSLLSRLIRIVIEQAGAQKGYVILHRDGHLTIEAEAVLDDRGVVVISLLRSTSAAPSPLLPSSIVNYVARTKRSVVLEDASSSARFAADAYIARVQPKSVLCLPILKQTKLEGLLYVENNAVAGAFTAAACEMLELLAAQAATSLQNALLLASEQAARVAAQEAERRAAFLGEASALLGESLDVDEVLQKLTELLVRDLATVCVIDLVEGGEIRRAAVEHADRAKQPLVDEIQRRYPSHVGGPHPASQVLRTGQPLLISDISDAELRARCVDDEHARLVMALEGRSMMCVPLIARGEVIGAISLVSCSPRRYFSTDLDVANELARRAALAIDNARLHRQTVEALRLRDEFLSVASHELRTPITSLQLMVQGLTEGLLPASPEQVMRAFSLARRQIGRLTRLIDELLGVSEVEGGRVLLDLEEVDLAEVVREVAQRLEGDRLRAGCALSMPAVATIKGRWDRSRLDRVVTNLLTNAMKFGAGRPIELYVEEAPPGRARLVVVDHGIGIPPDRLPHIFDRFERAVSAREYGGLGLGLYIARGIVAALGGAIRAESVPGAGCTMIVELPCAGPPSNGAPAHGEASSALSRTDR